MIKQVVLLKLGELTLKGLNRKNFENILIKNIKRQIKPYGDFSIRVMQSTVYLSSKDSLTNIDDVIDRTRKIFGVVSISKACEVEKDIDSILDAGCQYLDKELLESSSFKVEAKRSDKNFKLKSPQICALLGQHILKKFPHIKVDVHKPDITVTVEIRDFAAYVHGSILKGAGGMPVGTAGKAAVLISGGIDSPVASWMMSKRGMRLCAIHFASPPYTSERAEKKVLKLLEKVSDYSGKIKMITVPFTKIQEEIHKNCKEEFFTIIMRRIMFKISDVIARHNNCNALVTGESLGQVASQTIDAICCVDNCSSIPIFRPLIGMDKDEIVSIARKIDTFDISIQPFEDCCTVFTPKHPRIHPVLSQVISEENKIDVNSLIKEALNNLKYVNVGEREVIT